MINSQILARIALCALPEPIIDDLVWPDLAIHNPCMPGDLATLAYRAGIMNIQLATQFSQRAYGPHIFQILDREWLSIVYPIYNQTRHHGKESYKAIRVLLKQREETKALSTIDTYLSNKSA